MIRKAMQFKGIGIDQIAEVIRAPVLTTVSKLYGTQRFSLEEAFLLRERFFSEYTISELFSERGDQETQRLVEEGRRQAHEAEASDSGD